MPQLLASAAGPASVGQSLQQGSGPDGQPQTTAPVTVAAARQAMLSRLKQILGDPPSRPGGGSGAARHSPLAPLPATLLTEAMAYPSLVSTAAQRAEAQQQVGQQQPRPRVVPVPFPAHAVSQPRSSAQPAGMIGDQRPQGAGSSSAGRVPSCAVAPAAVGHDPAAGDSCRQPWQHAALAERAAVATHGTVPHPDRPLAQPGHPQADAAWHAPSQPVPTTRASCDACESGEETEDEAWAPPVKRQRRRTAAAAAVLAQRQQYASECEPPSRASSCNITG